MWAIAKHRLRLTKREFLSITPRQFLALYDDWTDVRDQRDFGLAILCATTANCYRDTDKHPEPFTPQEFFPWLPEPEEEVIEFTHPRQMKAFIDSQLNKKS